MIIQPTVRISNHANSHTNPLMGEGYLLPRNAVNTEKTHTCLAHPLRVAAQGQPFVYRIMQFQYANHLISEDYRPSRHPVNTSKNRTHLSSAGKDDGSGPAVRILNHVN